MGGGLEASDAALRAPCRMGWRHGGAAAGRRCGRSWVAVSLERSGTAEDARSSVPSPLTLPRSGPVTDRIAV